MPALLVALLPTLVPLLTATVGPLAAAGVRKIAPKIPKLLLPLVSVAVATASTAVTDISAGWGAVAGLVGIGIREIIDQAKKALPSA